MEGNRNRRNGTAKRILENVEDAEHYIGIALERLEEAANFLFFEGDRKIEDMVNHAYDVVDSCLRVVETVRMECEGAGTK